MGFFLTKKVKQDGTEGERDEQARQALKNPMIWPVPRGTYTLACSAL